VSQIKDGETIVIATMSVMDGVRQHLRQTCKGSRVIVIPDDIFKYTEGGKEEWQRS
jgi:adenine-specific DNA-methyltransferase